jgi:hypothetical protein
VTLHLPPPEIFTLDKTFELFSKITTSTSGKCVLTLSAEKKPAAPPPITATFTINPKLLPVELLF